MDNKKTLATIGFVLGIVTIIACWIPYASFAAIATGIAGIILCAIGKKGLQANGEKSVLPTIGLVLSIVGLVFGIIMSIVYCSCMCAVKALDDPTVQKSLNDLASQYGEDLASELGNDIASAFQ